MKNRLIKFFIEKNYKIGLKYIVVLKNMVYNDNARNLRMYRGG